MDKDIVKVKKLLKIDLFLPYTWKIDNQMRKWDSGVLIQPNDYAEERLGVLTDKCGLPDIRDCCFDGGSSVFCLLPPENPSWKGYFSLSFILPEGIDGKLDKNKPSEVDKENFIRFIRGSDE